MRIQRSRNTNARRKSLAVRLDILETCWITFAAPAKSPAFNIIICFITVTMSIHRQNDEDFYHYSSRVKPHLCTTWENNDSQVIYECIAVYALEFPLFEGLVFTPEPMFLNYQPIYQTTVTRLPTIRITKYEFPYICISGFTWVLQ